MNPTNWKDIETRRFHRNENSEPVGRESIISSPGVCGEGAKIVLSQ
jgi:hypothetical protein